MMKSALNFIIIAAIMIFIIPTVIKIIGGARILQQRLRGDADIRRKSIVVCVCFATLARTGT